MHHETHLSLVLAAAKMHMWSWDAQNDIVQWDPDLGPLFGKPAGWAPTDVDTYLALIHPDDRQTLRSAIERVFDGETAEYSIEHRVVLPDSRLTWLTAKGMLLRDADGAPTMLIGVVWDVGERKELEAALERARRLETVGRLAAGLTHDFSEALDAIVGAAQAMEDKVVDPEVASHLSTILLCASQATELTRKIHRLAIPEHVAVETTPLASTLNTALQGLRPLLSPLVLHARPVPASWVVQASEQRLTPILRHLLANARDAMRRSSGRATVSARQVNLSAPDSERLGLKNGRYIVIDVKDDGDGLPEDAIAHLFEPFYTSKAHGHGLGLASSYSIARRCGGTLALGDTSAQGTTMQVWLPDRTVQLEDTAPEPVADPVIMLVEDVFEVRNILHRVLRARSQTVYAMPDVQSAKESAAHRGHIDLLVTDILLPDGNGVELAEHLIELLPDLRIVFISGYSPQGYPKVGKNSTFLHKPFRNRELMNAIDDVMSR